MEKLKVFLRDLKLFIKEMLGVVDWQAINKVITIASKVIGYAIVTGLTTVFLYPDAVKVAQENPGMLLYVFLSVVFVTIGKSLKDITDNESLKKML